MNRTYSAKEEEIEKKWFVIDAENQVLGRLASEVARRLRGKHKPVFTPHADTGDYIIVINAEKIRLTGDKLDSKKYYRYSGYLGGMKEISARKQLDKKPEELIKHAVRGMLPKNSLGKRQGKKLKVYAGPEHPHEAQLPEPLEV
ncbi:MAG: 50S ribosomal protein L13 [Deltaproteobacteria bacterium]|nr:50S ribosomal protein L13 [Deltaproteobacteria bacterium]